MKNNTATATPSLERTSYYTIDEAIRVCVENFAPGYRKAQALCFADHYMVQYKDAMSTYNKALARGIEITNPTVCRTYANAGVLLETVTNFRIAANRIND